MAEALKKELGVDAELMVGGIGEFSVQVDGRTVAAKKWFFFPRVDKVVAAVRAAVSAPAAR